MLVPDLLRQHQLRVGGDAQQRLAEFERAVLGGLHHVAAAQQIDEVAEQALVEEFRRIQAVQHRHALRHQMAALLERLLTDGARPGLQQQRDHEVVALDRLNGGLGEQRQLDRLERGRGGALPFAAIRVDLQQLRADECVEQRFRHGADLRLRPSAGTTRPRMYG